MYSRIAQWLDRASSNKLLIEGLICYASFCYRLFLFEIGRFANFFGGVCMPIAIHYIFVDYNYVNYLLQELYVNIAWPLYRKYGHAFEVRMFTTCQIILGSLFSVCT